MNKISLLKKCRIKFALYKVQNQGLLPKKNLIFSPAFLFLDLIDDSRVEPINRAILNEIIFQINQHLNIQENLAVEITVKQDMWQPYSNDQKPISIKNNKIFVNVSHLYNHNKPENSMLNILESDFVALLCKEITRWFLKKNNIFLKSEFDVEMAMCLLGICKEAYLLPHVGIMYLEGGKIEHQTFFVSTREELSYAYNLCQNKNK